MDGIYKEFLVPGTSLTYPQKPDSLEVHAGFHLLRLTWLKAKDPSVVRAEIYWNSYLDSLGVDLQDKHDDLIVVDIPTQDESTYTFYVKTFDADGNVSIPAEASGAAYGDNYILRTTDRTIASALRDGDYNGTITWNAKTPDLAYTEVRYTTQSGEEKIVRILPEDNLLNCPDAKPGTRIDYRSVFLPPKGISFVEKEWVSYKNSFLYKYPRTTWTVEAKNGNHNWGDGGGGQPGLILDGNQATGWHSHTASALPQCLVVDMKQSLSIYQIVLYPPINLNWIYWDRVEFYFSDSPITAGDPQPSWGDPVADIQYPRPAVNSGWTIEFPDVPSAQYVALVFRQSTSSGPFINLMEFEVTGY
jgi:hypothetical protein